MTQGQVPLTQGCRTWSWTIHSRGLQIRVYTYGPKFTCQFKWLDRETQIINFFVHSRNGMTLIDSQIHAGHCSRSQRSIYEQQKIILWKSYIGRKETMVKDYKQQKASCKMAQSQGRNVPQVDVAAGMGMMGLFMVPETGLQSQSTKSLSLFLFSIWKMGIMISLQNALNSMGEKMIPDMKAKLFSSQHESSFGFLILSQFEICVPQQDIPLGSNQRTHVLIQLCHQEMCNLRQGVQPLRTLVS